MYFKVLDLIENENADTCSRMYVQAREAYELERRIGDLLVTVVEARGTPLSTHKVRLHIFVYVLEGSQSRGTEKPWICLID